MSLMHCSKFDIISKSDFEGEIMIVKTKTFTSDIFKHIGMHACFFFFALTCQ